MPKLPSIDGKQLLKLFYRLGYILEHIRGSHFTVHNSNGKRIAIPVHGTRPLAKGILLGILSKAGISRSEYIALREKI